MILLYGAKMKMKIKVLTMREKNLRILVND